jgi:hypothetical protein
MWAAWMCKDKNPDCPPEWLSDQEVYIYWVDSVSANGKGKVLYDGDEPQF